MYNKLGFCCSILNKPIFDKIVKICEHDEHYEIFVLGVGENEGI